MVEAKAINSAKAYARVIINVDANPVTAKLRFDYIDKLEALESSGTADDQLAAMAAGDALVKNLKEVGEEQNAERVRRLHLPICGL